MKFFLATLTFVFFAIDAFGQSVAERLERFGGGVVQRLDQNDRHIGHLGDEITKIQQTNENQLKSSAALLDEIKSLRGTVDGHEVRITGLEEVSNNHETRLKTLESGGRHCNNKQQASSSGNRSRKSSHSSHQRSSEEVYQSTTSRVSAQSTQVAQLRSRGQHEHLGNEIAHLGRFWVIESINPDYDCCAVSGFRVDINNQLTCARCNWILSKNWRPGAPGALSPSSRSRRLPDWSPAPAPPCPPGGIPRGGPYRGGGGGVYQRPTPLPRRTTPPIRRPPPGGRFPRGRGGRMFQRVAGALIQGL